MFGIDFFDPQNVWLNVMNLALGIMTLAAVLVFLWGVAAEMVSRWWPSRAHAHDDHAFAVPGLGMTMADGGKKLDEEEEE